MKEKFALARLKRKLLQHIQITRFLILVLAASLVVVFTTFVAPKTARLVEILSLDYRLIKTFVQGPSALKNTSGLINILILGVGGAGHQGPDLTDAMILFSYNRQTGKFNVISLPRDLWVPEIRAKINTTYHYGEEKKQGGGIVLTRSIIEELTGQTIHYVLVVDFNLFKEVINSLGGITVCVERGFDDFHYPIPGMETAQPETLRYEHLHFDQGCQTMDGEKALKFARSRNAEGSEGTDFARSKRQEKIILSLKDKLTQKGLFFDLRTFLAIKDSFLKNITTDINPNEYPAFVRLALKYRSQSITSGTLDTDNSESSHSGLLVNPAISGQYDYQWVLVPKAGSGNWTDIQKYISSLLTNQPN